MNKNDLQRELMGQPDDELDHTYGQIERGINK